MPQVDGVRHRFQAAGGLSFHVAEAGEGEPLLLLHGWPQHWYCWRLVIPELAKHYRVLAMDLRGFGWTDIAWEGLDKETMADDVANVMSALEIDRARIDAERFRRLTATHPALLSQLTRMAGERQTQR